MESAPITHHCGALDDLVAKTVTPVEDIVPVEDASDNDEAISQVTIEDPIFLITIEDNPMHSMTDGKEEIITIEDNPLHSISLFACS